jgi:2-iminobutanoate/2-iminopropanoate deaminase
VVPAPAAGTESGKTALPLRSSDEKQIVMTDEAPSSPLYSQAVRVGSTIYVSGTAGIDVATKQLVGTTIQEQTRQALRNCAAILEAGGGSLEDVVQVTVLLANPADFAGMNEAYAKVFAVDTPARAVTKLGVELPNLLVSIMMTAHVED